MSRIIIIIILSITSVLLNSFSVLFISVLLLVIGNSSIAILGDKVNRRLYYKIYNTSYLVYTLYAAMCILFMRANNFEYLYVPDTITAYIPYTKTFINIDSFSEMWRMIYEYGIHKYEHTGIITIYFAIIGKLASFFDNELFFNLQTSIIFLSSFIPIFIYKLLHEQGIQSALKYTYIYAFLSIHCYYSGLILRDIPISLMYAITFCYIMKTKNIKSTLVIAICIFITSLIRDQSALFLGLFFIILYIDKKIKIDNIILISIFTIIVAYLFYRLDALSVMNETLEHSDMLLQKKAGDSTLIKFNTLPPIISHIVKLVYVQLSPIPCWSYMNIFATQTEESNIMEFPRAIAVIYNYIILAYLLFGIYNLRKYKFNHKLLVALLFTLMFLGLQTDSVEQRRIMACYPILLLFACKVDISINHNESKSIKNYAILFFIIMQIIGITKYV